MKTKNIVFESPTLWHKWLIKIYLCCSFRVWVIEPFHTYHHDKGIRFFPPALPTYIDDLVKDGAVSLLMAEHVGATEVYSVAADKAVDTVEKVFFEYRKEHRRVIGSVCDILNSPVAENIFRKRLCERLAVFYSVNIMLHRIEQGLPEEPITIYPETNVFSYLYFRKLTLRYGQQIFMHDKISFPLLAYLNGFLDNVKRNIVVMARLFARTVASILLARRGSPVNRKKKTYRFGITIISPNRQLGGNQRGPDFIVDEVKIRKEDVVYFPLAPLSDDQKGKLSQTKGDVFYLSDIRKNFSHFPCWAKLSWLSLREKALRNVEVVSEARRALAEYFKWKKVMDSIEIKHFITHCDFDSLHIARNLALKQCGVQTWYFTDSMNFGSNVACKHKDGEKRHNMRHPFWSYLNYDHFITWNNFIAQYFTQHHSFINEVHVVGCLWADHINRNVKKEENMHNKFVIAAFDSTYSRNGSTSYQEGIAFAKHLLRLVNECPEVLLILKEKKARDIHAKLDPAGGPLLLAIYQEMDLHPRIERYTNQADSSDLISISDMVISFPFTSTTFEALSTNKPAIWHDPKGYYENTPYGKIGGVTTHSYDQLKIKILEFADMKPGTFQNYVLKNSALMDPYRDGKAIERFRDLLVT